MAWIESHQELRDHPKVIRLARLLGVDRTYAIGLLHLLWWWAIDHAEDGDISEYESADIADACSWPHDPEALVKALRECGPGLKPGFIAEVEGRWVLHNWWEYAGKLVARRRVDRDRKRLSRASSEGRPPDGVETRSGTEPNPTEQTDLQPPSSAAPPEIRRPDVDHLCDLLAELVEANGCRRPSVTRTWRTEARLLLDKDGVSELEAERVMRWALSDPFWKSNVLSIPKFRAKFDQLRLKAQQPARSSRSTPHERSQARLATVARAMGVGHG